MEALKQFQLFVKELIAESNANEFLEELYNKLFEKDDYDVFESTYAARCWLVEKLREAHEAQWNSKCYLIRKCIKALDGIDQAPALINGVLTSLDSKLQECDTSSVSDKASTIALLELLLVQLRTENQ